MKFYFFSIIIFYLTNTLCKRLKDDEKFYPSAGAHVHYHVINRSTVILTIWGDHRTLYSNNKCYKSNILQTFEEFENDLKQHPNHQQTQILKNYFFELLPERCSKLILNKT